MKRKLILGLLVVLSYLGFLIQQCPVARVLPWLPLPPGLTLSGARGTLWQGELDQISWQGKVLQKVGWQLPISSLLLFDPVVQLQFNDKETLRGAAELGWSGGVRLRDVDLQADAAWLLSQAPVRLPVPVTAAGQLHLQLTELRMTADRCQQLNGTLLWRGAEVQSPMGALLLDTAKADLGCQQGKLIAKLKQASEQLSLSGDAELDPNGSYRFQGKLTPEPGLPPAFAQGVNFLGQRDSQGAIRLDYQGRF